jgi:hypothetical protein
MAAPHVAGVVANMLGNAPTLTPAQVATQLVATATKSTLTGLPTATTNTLLYQQPASANSFSLSGEIDGSATVIDITADDSSIAVYEEDPGVPQSPVVTVAPKTNDGAASTPVGNKPVVPAVPLISGTPVGTVATAPSAPLAAPMRTSAMTNISIGKITKVGKQLRVTVNAPKGSKVSLYRNGKLVGKGVKKFFMVPVSKVKKQNFTAVISVAGAFVSSASVSLPVRSASLR